MEPESYHPPAGVLCCAAAGGAVMVIRTQKTAASPLQGAPAVGLSATKQSIHQTQQKLFKCS